MYGRLLDRGWLAVVLVVVAAAAALGAFLPPLRVDASTNALLDEKDPDLTYYSKSRRLWPSDDEFAIVCCPCPPGAADWFTPEALATLREIERELVAVPHVTKVLSMFSVPLLRQSPIPAPRTLDAKGIDLAKAREELTQHTLAKGTFISEDGRDVVLLAYLEQPPEYARLDREPHPGRCDPRRVERKRADGVRARLEQELSGGAEEHGGEDEREADGGHGGPVR